MTPGNLRSLIARALAVPAVLFGSPLFAESVNVNEFGNVVFPVATVSSVTGIPPIGDAGGSQSTNDDVRPQRIVNFREDLEDIRAEVDDILALEPPPTTEQFEEASAILDGLENIRSLFEFKIIGERTGSLLTVPINTVELNTPDFSVIEAALTGLQSLGGVKVGGGSRDELTSSSVAAVAQLIADSDPFITMTGAITNLSETESINAFLPFELAFEDPIALDTPLVRQALISAHIQDANDDGEASLRDASVQFSFFATEDPADPTFENTQSIGLTESLGVSRIPVDRLIERVGPVEPIDQSFIDRVSEDASFSHLLGEIRLLDISPGDTVSFRAIVSVGDPNDPNLPFLDAQDLNLMLSAIELVGRLQVPEPSSVWLLVSLVGLALPTHSRARAERQA